MMCLKKFMLSVKLINQKVKDLWNFGYTGVVNFKLKNFDAAIDDLKRCITQDEKNKYAYNYLVLSFC